MGASPLFCGCRHCYPARAAPAGCPRAGEGGRGWAPRFPAVALSGMERGRTFPWGEGAGRSLGFPGLLFWSHLSSKLTKKVPRRLPVGSGRSASALFRSGPRETSGDPRVPAPIVGSGGEKERWEETKVQEQPGCWGAAGGLLAGLPGLRRFPAPSASEGCPAPPAQKSPRGQLCVQPPGTRASLQLARAPWTRRRGRCHGPRVSAKAFLCSAPWRECAPTVSARRNSEMGVLTPIPALLILYETAQ